MATTIGTPIEKLLSEQAEWTEIHYDDPPDADLPFATHSGVWDFQGMQLRVHRLNDGRTIIEEESMREFMARLTGETA